MPHSALKSLYYTLIHSNLIYGILVWGNSSAVSNLFTLQKRAIRIINHKKYRAHTEPLFKINKILKLTDLYKFHVILFMFDYINNNLPISFFNLFHDLTHSRTYTTRQTGTSFYIDRPRTKFTSDLPFHNFRSIWNKINYNLKTISSRTALKRQIIKDFIDSYNDNIHCTNLRCRDCFPTHPPP